MAGPGRECVPESRGDDRSLAPDAEPSAVAPVSLTMLRHPAIVCAILLFPLPAAAQQPDYLSRLEADIVREHMGFVGFGFRGFRGQIPK